MVDGTPKMHKPADNRLRHLTFLAYILTTASCHAIEYLDNFKDWRIHGFVKCWNVPKSPVLAHQNRARRPALKKNYLWYRISFFVLFSLDKLINKRYRLMVICIAMRPVSRQMSLLDETHRDHVVLTDVTSSKPWYQYRINRACIGLAEARNDM